MLDALFPLHRIVDVNARLHQLSCTVLCQVRLFAFSDKRRNNCRVSVSDLGSDNLAGDNDFHAAILLATLGCVVVAHRVVHAKTLSR
jgi:hypothetical protein